MTTINDLAVTSSVSSADKFPIWSNANGVTRALPVSALDGRYITQDQINLLAISPTPEIFSAGDGVAPDTFVPGTTFALTLANLYGSGDNIDVFFDGTFQGSDQWALTAYALIFTSPIPVGVSKVYVKGGAARITNGVSPGSITDASVATDSRLYNRINDTISVKDFPFLAKGDGVTNDAPAINAAEIYAASVGKGLYFPAGTYSLAVNATVNKLSNVPWYGAGKKLSVIKAAAGAWTNAMISGGTVSGASFYHMGFDFSASTFHAFLRNIYFTTFSNGEVAHCDFIQLAIGFQADGGSYFSIHHCSFEQVTAYGNFINEAVWITRNTSIPTNYSYCDNTCVNVGTDFDGDVVLISRNNIQSWQYGAGITTEINSFGFTITDNYCAGGGPNLDGNGVPPDGIECWSNESVVKGNTVLSCAGVGINVGGSNMLCDGNICLNNGTYGGVGNVPSYRAGITLRYISAQVNGNTSIVSNNLCVDTGGGTQLWGITDDGANCGGSIIANNMFIGAFAPMNLGGIRYDFKGPKLQITATGSGGFTLAPGTSGGGNTGVSVSGAQLGDKATMSTNQNTQGLVMTAWVAAAGSVAWSFYNPTAASITIPNFTVFLSVEKPLNYANY